jgi:hypothetical protein
MMNCKSCRWNETHTSQFHGRLNCNQSTFCISAIHVFRGKLETTPSAENGLADAVMVMVIVGVTVQILRESGVPIRVILLLLVKIHLRVMESKSKMKSG